ncbi:MAG TPA: replicative DNA helicase [bacterium]|nr:replicative DNA helicase [bacterium]HQJ66275.1 replicative DNA helicase [bacterium]
MKYLLIGDLRMQAEQLPHNDYAEMVTIGCLLEGYAPEMILAELVPEDFYGAANRIIFSTCRDIAAAEAPIGIFTVVDRLRIDGNLEKIGGEAYLARCTGQVVSATQADGAVWGVKDAALLRHGYLATNRASREFAIPGKNAAELIDGLQSELLKISSRNREIIAQEAKDLMATAVSDIDSSKGRPGLSGITTGFKQIDYFTAGLQKGELIILAARPSMGKTSLMLNIAQSASLAGKNVYLFSLEMSTRQLALRMICSEAAVNSHHVRTGHFNNEEHERLVKAAAKLGNCQLKINDRAADLAEIVGIAKREAENGKLDLICIDYLQLISARFAKSDTRDREIGTITRQLKGLAKELDVPVLALSQLSRVNEAQKARRPTLNALRDSGNLEQDADTVIFLHSDQYYERESADSEQLDEWQTDVMIAKQRNGPTLDIPMLFRRQFTRFYPIDGIHENDTERARANEWYQN